MRIFKRKFSEDLVQGMELGECIITKINDSQYGTFVIHRKTGEGSFPYMGLFPLLEDAIKFAQLIEKGNIKYEYYCQYEKNTEEGWDRLGLETMGQLGWELCAIDPNTTKDGRSYYIYKRILPDTCINLNKELDNTSESNENLLETRNKIEGKISKYKYIDIDEFTTILEIDFGKNGLGLTSEISTIGKLIEELSKNNLVYIQNAFIDTCDDVYTLKFELKPIKCLN